MAGTGGTPGAKTGDTIGDLRREMKLLNYHKLANEAALKAAIIRTKRIRGKERGKADLTHERNRERQALLAQVAAEEETRPLEVDEAFLEEYKRKERVEEQRLEAEVKRHITNLQRLKQKLKVQEDRSQRNKAYHLRKQALGDKPNSLEEFERRGAAALGDTGGGLSLVPEGSAGHVLANSRSTRTAKYLPEPGQQAPPTVEELAAQQPPAEGTNRTLQSLERLVELEQRISLLETGNLSTPLGRRMGSQTGEGRSTTTRDPSAGFAPQSDATFLTGGDFGGGGGGGGSVERTPAGAVIKVRSPPRKPVAGAVGHIKYRRQKTKPSLTAPSKTVFALESIDPAEKRRAQQERRRQMAAQRRQQRGGRLPSLNGSGGIPPAVPVPGNHLATVQIVRQDLASNDSSHDFFHIQRVMAVAKTIAEREEFEDVELVQFGALLHDVKDHKYSGEEGAGEDFVRHVLTEAGVDAGRVEEVAYIVANVGFKNTLSGSGPPPPPQPRTTKALHIVTDADRLDAIGAIGVARCLTFGGARNRVLYDPEVQPKLGMSKEEYSKHEGTTINHFYEKLLLLKDKMHTDAGKAMAQARHDYMEGFLGQFLDEWQGKA